MNQVIIFFLHQNQNIFFSNIGNQNIFLEKKPYPYPICNLCKNNIEDEVHFLISSPGPKVHVNYCHHLASVVCRLSSVVCRL